jgi:hypothetical protein
MDTECLCIPCPGQYHHGAAAKEELIGLVASTLIPTTVLPTSPQWGEQPGAIAHHCLSSDEPQKTPQEIACTQESALYALGNAGVAGPF